ncbi:MAG TPA: hypothetical protein VKE98_09090 [Gemmataceae bacterium]|nr:hypothetical protein [Gemmataceae bacterium]
MSETIHAAGTPQTQPEPQAQAMDTPQAEARPQVRRDANGRFAIGNDGGPGNPFARQTAALHAAFLESTTAEDMKAIADKLIELAKGGNVAAAKLVLQYTIGKPAPAVQPDNLDAEEWEHIKTNAWKPLRELQTGMGPGLEFPLLMARTSRPGFTRDHARMFYEAMQKRESAIPPPPQVVDPRAAEWLAKELEKLERAKHAGQMGGGNGRQQPSANGKKSARPPSANGEKPPSENGERMPLRA